MNRLEVSKITCIADVRLAARIEAEMDRMGLRETYTERGKQVALQARPFWQPFGRRFLLMDAPADLVRFYVPRAHELAAMARLAAAADLFLPGRGSIFAEDATLVGEDFRLWDEGRLCVDPPAWAIENRLQPAPYEQIFCILPRGRGGELARTLLEMGLGVPIVGYGEGMGLRDRLGLLRVAIPQEKEVLWLLVPPGDADFVVDVAIRKGNLREPGNGFIGRIPVRALAVNARMNLDRRRHVATMEQVISTLDLLRGSTDWRRMTAASRPRPAAAREERVHFTLVCEEGTAAGIVRAALDAGAGGATLSRLSRRAPETPADAAEEVLVSHARESCDLVVPAHLLNRLEDAVTGGGLFAAPANGFIEIGPVRDPLAENG